VSGLYDVLSGRKRIIILRTRQGWRAQGRQVQPKAEGWLVPFVPSKENQIHIRRVRIFSEADLSPQKRSVKPGPAVKRYCMGFTSVEELHGRGPILLPKTFWSRLIFCRPTIPGAARNKHERFMDRYWFVYNPDLVGSGKIVPDRRYVIYPPSLFKKDLLRLARLETDRKCRACDKTFQAKRKDAKYCSPACRKWGSRQPSKKPENG
jgi:hypothetical protein